MPSTKDRIASGKALRANIPRIEQGKWSPASDRPDPISLLKTQDALRVKTLVPNRYQRMLESPFAFMRGSALVMAHDLEQTPNTGVIVHACGDCHLSNFGGYATPERNFVFDINDFDEALPAPWEWDVKRLAASCVVAGRSQGFDENCCRQTAIAAARNYREHTARLAKKTALEVWYSELDVADTIKEIAASPEQLAKLQRGVRKARSRTPEVLFLEMTEPEKNGARRFADNPPYLYHVSADSAHGKLMRSVIVRYKQSLRLDVRALFDRYQVVDSAVKVVGVGSVGTRCGVMLFMAREDDALVLQIKEAMHSVLEVSGRRSVFPNQGERVVNGQRIMQAASDLFLGWTSYRGRDYYIRQLRDMKASIEVGLLTGQSFVAYAQVCGKILARAHARSGHAATIAGYLGKTGRFDTAIAAFARKYADQTERDYAEFKKAVRKGKLRV